MKHVMCTRGMVALVDDTDFDLVSRHRWHAVANNKKGDIYYARTTVAGRFVWMHNLIIGCEAPHRVDHQDGDGLNNQRINLRPCTRSQNMANSPVRRNHSKTGFRGVYFIGTKSKPYSAQIRVDRRLVRLGTFHDPALAARAYDTAAAAFFGEFASLNFPDPGMAADRPGRAA